MPRAEPWHNLFSLGRKISKSSYQEKSQPEKKGKKEVKIWVWRMDPKFLCFPIPFPLPLPFPFPFPFPLLLCPSVIIFFLGESGCWKTEREDDKQCCGII